LSIFVRGQHLTEESSSGHCSKVASSLADCQRGHAIHDRLRDAATVAAWTQGPWRFLLVPFEIVSRGRIKVE
jgi:hypothetical protein